MRVSFIVPTLVRPSLAKTLASIECWPGDEILVVGNVAPGTDGPVRYLPCAPGHDWGHTERNYASLLALGDYVAHIDDDDCYAPGTRAAMEDAMQTGRPVLFRMAYPNGVTLWREPRLTFGNVGTPMMLIPNQPERFGTWGAYHGGDFGFLSTMKWLPSEIVWRPEVIAQLGHNSEWAEQQLALGVL